jgi:hypothetical protein
MIHNTSIGGDVWAVGEEQRLTKQAAPHGEANGTVFRALISVLDGARSALR